MPTRASVVIVGLNYTPEVSGNAPYTASLATGLAARGWDTRVVTTYPHYPEWRIAEGYGGWSTSSRQDGVRVDRKRHFVPRRPSSIVRLLSELSFGVRAVATRWGRPDVVVLVSPGLFACALALLRVRLTAPGTPVVTWVQDLYSLGVVETGQGGPVVARLMARVESWVLTRSSAVAVIHDRFREHAVAELGVRADSVRLVRNWTHLPEPAPVDRDAVRTRYGWSPEDVVVLHSGNMGVKQGLENVVDAARLASDSDSRVRFVLLGGGSQRDRLRELGRDVARLTFLDALAEDEFQAAMASADVLLVNEKEGVAGMAVPSKLTSYFSTGRPVIAATDPGSVTEGEVLLSGGGVVVPAGRPRELLDAAVALGSDDARSAALGAAGLRFRREHLTEAAAVDSYAQVLAALVARKPRGPRRFRTRS